MLVLHGKKQGVPHYRLHLRDGVDELLDPDGVYISADAVPGFALRAARDCIAGDVMNGRIEFKYRIDVEDDRGTVVHSIAFIDAIEIIPSPA